MDRETVIKGLEWILEDDRFGFGVNWYVDCVPQCEEEQAGYNITRAIELLKEQQKQIEQMNFIYGFVYGGQVKEIKELVRCKDCKQSGIDSTSYPHYWCSAHAEYHDGAWFCADGEKAVK